MAVTAHVYGNAAKHTDGDSYLANDIRVALLTSAYTPAQATDEFWSAIVANEVAGTGYTANGLALAGKTANQAGNVIKLIANNAVWSASTITARYAVVYDRTPASDATRPLIAYVDFGANVISTNGNFTITWDANGIGTITAA